MLTRRLTARRPRVTKVRSRPDTETSTERTEGTRLTSAVTAPVRAVMAENIDPGSGPTARNGSKWPVFGAAGATAATSTNPSVSCAEMPSHSPAGRARRMAGGAGSEAVRAGALGTSFAPVYGTASDGGPSGRRRFYDVRLCSQCGCAIVRSCCGAEREVGFMRCLVAFRKYLVRVNCERPRQKHAEIAEAGRNGKAMSKRSSACSEG